MEKTWWRCSVCGDLHYGRQAPEVCPTCNQPRAKAAQITKEEVLKIFEK